MNTCPRCGDTLRHAYEGNYEVLVCLKCAVSTRTHERAARNASPEDDMLREIIQLRDAHISACPDLRWLHHGAGESIDARRGAIMRGKGAVAGILDLEWPLLRVGAEDPFGGESTSDLHGLAIELKYGKRQLTQPQHDRMRWLQEQCWRVMVCRAADEAWYALWSYAKWRCSCSACEWR